MGSAGGGQHSSGPEQFAAPPVTPTWKSPTNVVSSLLCLTWGQGIARAGDLGCSRVLVTAVGYQRVSK